MLTLDLVDKGLVTDQIVVTVGYDIENLTDPERRAKYHGAVVKYHYGRQIPKHSHGTANHVVPEADAPKINDGYEQLDLFIDYAALQAKQEQEQRELEREKRMQKAMLTIKKKFGKNATLKGMNLEEGATAKDRNEQIGGHKA